VKFSRGGSVVYVLASDRRRSAAHRGRLRSIPVLPSQLCDGAGATDPAVRMDAVDGSLDLFEFPKSPSGLSSEG